MTAPLVLLPIRIETAFSDRVLTIRIYPDEPHLDRRSPATTPGESRARAPVRPRWLPVRWVATGWRNGQRKFLVEGPPIDAEHLAMSPDFGSPEPERDMRWMTDIAEAERVGMALKVTLDEPRLDRLVVFGVRGSETSEELRELLEVHRDTDGVGFIAPGTPTNQVGPEVVEPAPAAGDEGGAAAQIARAFGIPRDTLMQAPGADRDEETIARAMATALWPATWGYFLTSMMPPVALAPPALDQVRAHFIKHVRASGPLPALRIGAQPYAILPTTSLARWVPHSTDLDGLAGLLRRFTPLWRNAATQASDGTALLDAMRIAPYSQRIEARAALGRHFVANLFEFLGAPDLARWNQQQEQLGTTALAAAGLAWKPRIAHAVFDGDSFVLRRPHVDPLFKQRGRIPTEVLGAVNYVAWLRDASVEDLRAQVKIPRNAPPLVISVGGGTSGTASTRDNNATESGVFYTVLRHATLRAYADAAARVIRARTQTPWPSEIEPELAGGNWSSPTATIWNLFADHLPRDHRTDAPTIATWLRTASTPETAQLMEHRASLTTLAGQPVAALERHFVGVIDLCAYRLDAWVTSVATRRLAWMRGQDQPVQLGAYGWVENLAARGNVESEGFVLTPSMTQAATAAILRSGYRARRLAGDAGALAVDLSSERARIALGLLDGVRRGLPLGEQLGAMLERALHDAGLDRYIARFRRAAPAREGAIVDGETLLERWRASHDLPGFDWGGDRAALVKHLDRLEQALDAVGDVALAEGVSQAVRGNPEQAAAIFDALGRGEQPPPDASVLTSPRSAVRHTARLLVGLRPREAPAARWQPGPHAIRGRLAPELDAWADSLLGDPRQIRLHAEWRGDNDVVVGRKELQLAQLGLSALDVVYLAGDLEAWLSELAARTPPSGVSANARIVLDRARVGDAATLDETLAIARAMREVLDRARPARVQDFTIEIGTGSEHPARLVRAREARDALRERIDAAVADTASTIPRALAAFAIAAQDRETAIAVARTRVAAASSATDAAAIFAAVFNASFPAPAITQIPEAARTSFTARGDRDSDAVVDWISAVGRARDAAGRFDDLLLLGQALARDGRFELAQLPDQPDLPPIFSAAATTLKTARLALALYTPDESLGDRMATLVIDEWVEAVPSAEETAGIGFHLDRPNAEAPQAILVAVPPDVGAPWSHDSIESVLIETLDLAAVRSVPPEALGAIAQIVPATVFAFNAAGEAISTDFTPLADG